METPEMLLRQIIFEDYLEGAVQIKVEDLEDLLKEWPGVFWNAYSMTYGFLIKPFPYPARNGYFVDMESRTATHRFTSKGIVRRDLILKEENYLQIVPEAYRQTWFDLDDAVRCYSVVITSIEDIEDPIKIENFGLYGSWGKVSRRDRLQRPRLIKPNM